MFNIRSNNNPCFECKDRVVNCHSTCEKYLKWKQEYEQLKKNYHKQVNKKRNGYY